MMRKQGKADRATPAITVAQARLRKLIYDPDFKLPHKLHNYVCTTFA